MNQIMVRFGVIWDEWYQQFGNQRRVKISVYAQPISANVAFVMYATDLDRLFSNMQNLSNSVYIDARSEIRYEYWKSEDHPTSLWSLNSARSAHGMKYAGVKAWVEGNHRIVICQAGKRNDNSYSRVILRGASLTQNTRLFRIPQLLAAIQKSLASAEHGEGCGDAVEVAATDGIVPFLSVWFEAWAKSASAGMNMFA